MEAGFSPIETDVFAINPQYREGQAMPCPDCGGNHWIIGRVVAECAQCETLLPLVASRHRRWIDRVS